MHWIDELPLEYRNTEDSYSINLMAVRMFRNQHNAAIRLHYKAVSLRSTCPQLKAAAQSMLSSAGLSTACVVGGFDNIAEAFMLCGVVSDDVWQILLNAPINDAAAVLLLEADRV